MRGLKRLLGRVYLGLFGWEDFGAPPDIPKFVLIAAPHTSNWDFPFMLAFAWVHGIRLGWLGKHTLFRPPFGWFFRATGGVAVDRRAPQGLVAQVAEAFERADRLIVAIPPEASRSRREYWKSGFYRIAEQAGVPIVLGVLDFAQRKGGFGPVIEPSGDLHADMDLIREFYADKTGKRPQEFGPVRLRDEDER